MWGIDSYSCFCGKRVATMETVMVFERGEHAPDPPSYPRFVIGEARFCTR